MKLKIGIEAIVLLTAVFVVSIATVAAPVNINYEENPLVIVTLSISTGVLVIGYVWHDGPGPPEVSSIADAKANGRNVLKSIIGVKKFGLKSITQSLTVLAHYSGRA
jgi:hypothetical protein